MKHEQTFGMWQYTDRLTGLRLTLHLPAEQQCKSVCKREGGKCTVCGDPKSGKDGEWTTLTPRPRCPLGCKETIGGTCSVCGDGYHVPVALITNGGHAKHWMACVQTKPWCTPEILVGLRQALSAVLRARGVDSAA